MLLKRLPFLLLAVSVSARAQTEPLRLTLGDAIRRALGTGTQTELARSNEELARIARSEALNALLPQADAKLMRYNQSINLATFGFTLPGFPAVVGPFNVTDAQLAAAVLLNAVGADESSDVVIADEPTVPTTVPAIDTSLASARTQRPELRQAEENERAAKLTVDAARARLLPSVSLDFEGDMSGNRTHDLHWSRRIGANLGVPLFHADINANIARAKVQLHDAQTRRTQLERDVEQDVRRSLMTLQNAESRVAVATENVQVAEEALTVARDRRAAGYGSPVEVDRAQDAYRQAHEDLIAAQSDAAAAQFD